MLRRKDIGPSRSVFKIKVREKIVIMMHHGQRRTIPVARLMIVHENVSRGY